MNRLATLLLLSACWLWPAEAQPVRNGQDVIWARDVDGASITFDGALDEAVWGQAESVRVTVNNSEYFTPGGGWQIYAENENPSDPVDATVYFLRDGNTLWVGVDARDASIGGTGEFFLHDGIVMSVNDQLNRTEDPAGYSNGSWGDANWFPASNTDEFFYTWLNLPDFGIPDSVGMDPTFLGNHASANVPDTDKWDARAVVNGVSNDDYNGNASPTPDVGYTMEIRFNLDNMGYNMNAVDGDAVGLTFGIYDVDYRWPAGDGGEYARTRAWWQNPWGGDQPFGVARVLGQPGVTVSSGDVPVITEPDIRLSGVPESAAITVDGVLDEGIWDALDPLLQLQYQATPEELDMLPGYGPYYTGWFRPGGGPDAPPVLDPTVGTFKMFHQGSTLYVSLDTDDAAISGQVDENRADGFRFMLRDLGADSVAAEGSQYPGLEFMVVIDSTGAARPLQGALNNPAITVGAAPKGSSTPGNPNDVDTGYAIEMAIDLDLLGYPLDAVDRQIWFAINYFDGDDLPVAEDSYGMRTWFLGERAGNMQGARTYLDPELIVANEGGVAVPAALTLGGNAPNPFRGTTAVRYALPEAGDVTVRVFDVLGREVAVVEAGLQPAGPGAVTFDGRSLASGVYLYRVELGGEGAARASATGRMLLVK